MRTYLVQWQSTVDVQLAGLCHAAYGTDGFGSALLDLDRRSRLAGCIGAQAEQLVYLYGCCDRASTYPRLGEDVVVLRDRFTGLDTVLDKRALRSFAQITAANELDVVLRNPDLARKHGAALRSLVERMGRLLPDEAIGAWRDWSVSGSPTR